MIWESLRSCEIAPERIDHTNYKKRINMTESIYLAGPRCDTPIVKKHSDLLVDNKLLKSKEETSSLKIRKKKITC